MSSNAEDLCYLTIREAGALLRGRKLSPVELTRAHLDRVEQLDGILQAFITVLGDSALDQARAAENEILQGAYRGPLHGIPIGLKDLYDTAGVRTTPDRGSTPRGSQRWTRPLPPVSGRPAPYCSESWL